MITFWIVCVLVISFNIFSFILLSRKVRVKEVLIFSTLFNVSVSIWQLSLLYTREVADFDFIHRLSFFAASWVVISYLGLSKVFPHYQLNKIWRRMVSITAFINFIFSILLFKSNLVISSYILSSKTVVFGSIGNIYLIFLFLGVISSLSIYIYRYIKQKEDRFYFRYILVSFAFAALVGLFTNLLLPISGNSNLSILGSLAALIPQLAITYTIGFGKLSSLGYIFGYLLKILLRTILLFSLFYLSLLIYFQFQDGFYSASAYIRGIGIALLIAVIMDWIEKFIQEKIAKNIQFGNLSPLEIRDTFSRTLRDKLELDKSSLTINDFLKTRFNIATSTVIIVGNSVELYIQGENENITKKSLQYLTKVSKILETDLITQEEINQTISQINYPSGANLLKREKIEIVFTKKIDEQNTLFIFIGRKKDLEPFTYQELKVIQEIGEIASGVLIRSIFFQAVKDYNESLERGIKRATKQLNQKVEALELARKKEQEMMDIMGHELRTPLSIIRMNFGLLYEKIKNYSKLENYTQNIKEGITRESKLITMLLGATKIEKGQIELNIENISLIDIIKSAYEAHKEEVKLKKLNFDLVYKKSLEKLVIEADKLRMQEVFDNLIGNAIKYTQQGTVQVQIERLQNIVKVQIKDTGRGISKEAISHLGEKFFREDTFLSHNINGNLVKPGGTGLGLYVSFGIIKEHNGKVEIESKVGKGTVITLKIPIVSKKSVINSERSPLNVYSRLKLKKTA